MYGILITSLVSMTLILRRFYQLWVEFRIDSAPLMSRVSQLINVGDYGQAVQLAQGKHPLHRLMQAALLRANRPEKDIRRGVETTAVPAESSCTSTARSAVRSAAMSTLAARRSLSSRS